MQWMRTRRFVVSSRTTWTVRFTRRSTSFHFEPTRGYCFSWVVSIAAYDAAFCGRRSRLVSHYPSPLRFPVSYDSDRAAPAERPVDGEIVLRHAGGREALLEALAHQAAVETRHAPERRHRRVDRVDDEAGAAVFDQFGHRAVRPGDHRRAAGHRLDHGEAERLGPVDRKEQRRGIAQERRLLRLGQLAHEFGHGCRGDQRLDMAAEVFAVGPIDLRGDAQARTRAARDLDGALQPVLGRDTVEECEISASWRRIEGADLARESVMHRTRPVGKRQAE